MELLKYVYFYTQKSIIKAGNNKFQDLINAPRILLNSFQFLMQRIWRGFLSIKKKKKKTDDGAICIKEKHKENV